MLIDHENIFNYRGLHEQLARILNDAKSDIVDEMKRQKKFVTGRTAESIEVRTAHTDDGIITGQILAPISLLTLETGRRDGKIPHGFADIIERWAVEKRLQFKDAKERRRFAACTARKIMREGSKIYRRGVRENVYSGALKNASDRIVNMCNDSDVYDVQKIEQSMPTTKISIVI